MFQFQYFHIPRTLSRDYCARALQALETTIRKPQEGIIHLIVIPSEEMARMNMQFRGKEGPTDILTFSYLEKVQKTKYKIQRRGFLNNSDSTLPPEKGGQGGLETNESKE